MQRTGMRIAGLMARVSGGSKKGRSEACFAPRPRPIPPRRKAAPRDRPCPQHVSWILQHASPHDVPVILFDSGAMLSGQLISSM